MLYVAMIFDLSVYFLYCMAGRLPFFDEGTDGVFFELPSGAGHGRSPRSQVGLGRSFGLSGGMESM